MFQLHIRVLAREDIQQIVDYYDEKSADITDIFLDSLYTEFDVIADNTELFQVKYRKTRVRYIKGFSYGIHYILKGQTIEILAVLHTSRDSENWKNR
jgi:plasmid stabilization system protein ParE